MGNLNFLKYLREDSSDSLPSGDIHIIEQSAEESDLTKKINEVEKENAPKFIDEETGKEYKTEAALKAARTRRHNKMEKARKNDK